MPTAQEIAAIFNQFGVPIASQTESPEQRLSRILSEVNSGRTMDSVINSVAGIAQREGWQPNPAVAANAEALAEIQAQIAAIGQTPVTTSNGFNAVAAAETRGVDRTLADLTTSVQQALNNLSQDRTRAVGDVERNQSDMLRQLQARMADQGILRSGINIGARGELNEDHVRNIERIQDLYQRGVTDENFRQSSGTNTLNSQREIIAARAAQEEAAERLGTEQQRAQTLAGLNQQASQLTAAGQATSGNSVMDQIRQGFLANNVPIATGTESAQQRLSRIASEVDGGRTLDHVLGSIQGIARQQGMQPQTPLNWGIYPTLGTPTYGTYRPYG